LWLVLALMSAGCAFEPPTAVVDEVVDAARRGDRDDFEACFTARSRPIIALWWARTDELQPALGQLAAGDVEVMAVRPYRDRDGMGAERAVVAVREGGRTMPWVVHKVGGRWRIDLLDTERVAQTQGLL